MPPVTACDMLTLLEDVPMTKEDLHEAARRQPFQPFRVTLTTGSTYDIRHPDLIMVGRRSAVIGITNDSKGQVYDRTLKVDLMHGRRRRASCQSFRIKRFNFLIR
jgi:hypothetical protein